MEMREFGSHMPVNRPPRATEVRPNSVPAAHPSRSAAVDGDLTSHSPAPELEELMSRLSELPATRAEAIQGARDRLAEGYYLTRTAAVRAAGAILAE
jgi:hypothetical protein